MKKLSVTIVFLIAFSSVAHATVLGISGGGTALQYPLTGFQTGSCLTGNGLSAIGTTTCSGSGSGSGTVATSTQDTSGESTFFTSTNGTPARIGGDLNFFWDNTNKRLGIGTSTPGFLLSVANTTNASAAQFTSFNNTTDLLRLESYSSTGFSSIGFFDNGTNQKGGFGYANSAGGAIGQKIYFYSTGNADMVFSTDNGSNDILALKANNGNVGVGSSSPFATLSVEESGTTIPFIVSDQGTSSPVFVVGAAGTIGINSNPQSTSLGRVNIGPSGDTSLANTGLCFAMDSGACLQHGGSTNTINVTGNLFALTSLGASNNMSVSTGGSAAFPAYRLSNGNNGMYSSVAGNTVFSSNGIFGAILDNSQHFGVATSSPWGQLSASSSSAVPTLAIEQKGTGPAAVILGGNVGVGTTSPGYTFGVSGTNVGYHLGSADVTFDNTTGTVARLQGSGDFIVRSNGGNLQLQSSGGIVNVPGTLDASNFTSASLAVAGGLGVSKTLLVSGNAAVGTTTSTNTFTVANSTGGAIVNLDTTSANGAYIQLANAATAYGYFGSAKALTGGINSVNDVTVRSQNNLTFDTNGASEAMRITSGGNVGIGTTTPTEKLAVSGSGATRIVVNDSTGGGNARVIASGADAFIGGGAGSKLFLQSNSTNQAVIDTSGNFGIGTSTPGSIFSIGGILNATTATTTYYSSGGIDFASSVGNCPITVAGTCLTSTITLASAYKAASNWATVAVLSGTPTYSNGTGGVGATLTEVGTGALSVDGNSPAAGDRVLVKNQASAFQNGIYTVTATGSGIASYILTRSSDFNSPTDVFPGVATYIIGGAVNIGDTYVLTTTGAITIGTTNLTFAEQAPGGISAGNGIAISGSTVSFDVTKEVNNTLQMWNGSQLQATGTPSLTVGYLIATTTTASQIPNATTTQLTVKGPMYDSTNSAGASTNVWTSQGANTAPHWAASGGGSIPAFTYFAVIGHDDSATTVTANVLQVGTIQVISATTLTGITTANGSAAAGNILVGLYDSTGTLVASSASTAMTGTFAGQKIPFSGTYSAAAGTYYVGILPSSSSASFYRVVPIAPTANLSQGSFVLPGSITPPTGVSAFAVDSATY